MATVHNSPEKKLDLFSDKTDEVMLPLTIEEKCKIWAMILLAEILLVSVIIMIF